MTQGTGRPRRSSPLFTIVVLVLVAGLAVEAYIYFTPRFSRHGPDRPAIAQEEIAGSDKKIETFGESSAPLELKLYAPLTLPWHQKTIALLRKYNEDHPGRVRVILMPMGLEGCDEEMDYSCARILINGENVFTLPDGREVTLEKRPTDESYPTGTYSSEDVITILDQLYQAASS